MPNRVDQSPKIATKVPPMYSPRINGGGVLASRAIPPSPLSKGLEGPLGPVSSQSVDYDDVFGGPPRFATSMSAAQDNHGSSAALDRSVARAPSFRSPACPVFELPVFGDAAFCSSNSFEPRPASVAYDDIFREEVHVPDVYPESAMSGNFPRSKASSRSASRRMSPVHPAASLSNQLLHEEILAAANTGAFSKGRSSVGAMEGRNSFSSSSFDEVRNKPLDSVFMAVKNDTAGSSLPPSPPHSGTWGYVKRFTTSKSVHNLSVAPASREVDDVFGGFPQRTYPPVFQAASHDTCKSSRMPNASSRGLPENKVPRSPLKVQSSEPHSGLRRTLSSSSSSEGERELQDDFIEIRMDKQSDAATEKNEAAANSTWVTASDLRQLAQSTLKRGSARPPPVPAPAAAPPSGGMLKHKSWKDWNSNASECPPVYSPSSDLAEDTSMAFGTGLRSKKELSNGTSTLQQDKGINETHSNKQIENNAEVQPTRGKFTIFSPLRTALKAKPLVETLQLEERELHAMLNNAWKSNEKREKKKGSALSKAEVLSAVDDTTMQDSGLNDGKKQTSKVPNNLSNQQGSQSIEDNQAGRQWKSWKKHTSREMMDKKGSTNDSRQMKAPGHSVQDIIEEKTENCVCSNLVSENEDSFDPEEIVKEVTEEMSANGLTKEVDGLTREVDSWSDIVGMKSVRKVAEGVEIADYGKPVNALKAESEVTSEVTSALSSRNGSVQDFVQYSDQQEVSLSEGVEEADSLIGLDASLVGFQDIEGESVDRRKARWVRHLRAKQRAARALEEMQQRDAELLRQQAEKQQLAENADKQIKRWATGKEGNLRALLSNLQHVLWTESGWKPISLTDLIEGPDVKKAYRKATLFVHPDKLQQKGATLQQKYIAERVFDILQEAWKTFNLQELF